MLAEALELPESDRARVASELLASLDGPNEAPDELERAWTSELERRAREVREGSVELVDHEAVMDELRTLEEP